AYLEHAPGAQLPNPFGRAFDPFAHLGFGNRIARIATPPACGLRGDVMPVSLVPDRLPVRGCRSATLGGRDDVSDEPLCASRIRSGHDCALSYRGMSIQYSL